MGFGFLNGVGDGIQGPRPIPASLPSLSRTVLLHEPTMVDRHQRWMTQYREVYKNQAEKEKRFNIFKANVEFIKSSNVGNKPYKLGVNEFADQTIEEFKSSRNGYKKSWKRSSQESTAVKYENVTAVPSTMDWKKERTCNTSSRTKDRCCWAFSAVAAMEGITQLTTGKLTSLSEQELVDEKIFDGYGGLMDDAFEFIKENQGLTTEANYAYNGPQCYEDVPANNEASLLKAVSKQPVSVAIDASGQEFQFYSSGVFTGTCGTELDHGVTAVGYGTDIDGTKYWLVKNSWGTSWGENGYIRMQRDVDANQGLCGTAMEASYPTA
ncbi:hypothetical protein MKX03_019006 [Papaver bracteatum]|nr:hypothetical protein MKX03_019006 [Papaver bracteatum]